MTQGPESAYLLAPIHTYVALKVILAMRVQLLCDTATSLHRVAPLLCVVGHLKIFPQQRFFLEVHLLNSYEMWTLKLLCFYPMVTEGRR